MVFRGSKTSSQGAFKRVKGFVVGGNYLGKRRLVWRLMFILRNVFKPDNYLYHVHRLIKIKAKISNISAIINQKL